MAGASAYHFGRASFKAGRMTRAQLARDGFEQLRFRLNGSTDAAVNVLLDRLLGHLKGTPAVETARLMPDALAGILPRVYPQMIEVVRRHQAEGRPCYIATAAGQEMATILATALVMEGAIGTRFEVDEQGMFTGRLEGPFAYGDGKARAVAEFADREGIDLSRSWAYSDSASDLPLLELVGHPGRRQPRHRACRDGRARRLGGDALREARPAPANRTLRADRRRRRRQRHLAGRAAQAARRRRHRCQAFAALAVSL